jgi:hypothetical protein
MKRRIIYIVLGLLLVSSCGIVTSCSSDKIDEYGMRQSRGKKSQKVRQNYKVKGWGDASNTKKKN